MKNYLDLRAIECLAGDTLPTFNIQAEEDISSCSMTLVVTPQSTPTIAVLSKTCEWSEDRFLVQITSDDTNALQGLYNYHVELTDEAGYVYKPLKGTLYVHANPTPDESEVI